jgi:hypothetical protein
MTIGSASFDCARLLNHLTKQQQLFGDGGLTGVGVRNDGKGAAARGFLGQFLGRDHGQERSCENKAAHARGRDRSCQLRGLLLEAGPSKPCAQTETGAVAAGFAEDFAIGEHHKGGRYGLHAPLLGEVTVGVVECDQF